MYGNENLIALAGSTPAKFGVNLARKLFSVEELIDGTISPHKKSQRKTLPEEKVFLMKSEHWSLYSYF
jgi:hypothetical protein